MWVAAGAGFHFGVGKGRTNVSERNEQLDRDIQELKQTMRENRVKLESLCGMRMDRALERVLGDAAEIARLTAEVERLHENHEAAAQAMANTYAAASLRWQAEVNELRANLADTVRRANELTSEVDRLKNKKCVHDRTRGGDASQGT